MKKLLLACIGMFLINILHAQIPVLNSRTTASAVLYLDFDGHIDNSLYWSDLPIVAAAPTITSDQITEIWRRVSEDFAPFNINITTEVAKYNAASSALRQRVVFTPTNYFYLDAGGVANIGSFGIGERPCWAFYGSGVFNPKQGAEVASHEAGHTLGLRHQSEYNSACAFTAEYNDGTLPSDGQTSWAPIMGVGYYRNLTTWYHGPGKQSKCADGNQNDIGLILLNGFSYISDDANNCGLTTACSKVIYPSSNNLSAIGILKTNSENDYYRFTAPRTGIMVFTGAPKNITGNNTSNAQYGQNHDGANLDIALNLFSSTGTPLANSAYNDTRLDAIFSVSVTLNQSYYIQVQNDGLPSYRDFGYKNDDDYGIIGNYILRGFYPGVLASGSSVLCPNVSIGFSTLPSSGSTYKWYYKSGSAAAPSVLSSTAGWTQVAGATSSSLIPASGVGTRTYACLITNAGVSAWASGVRIISSIVPSVSQAAIASGNQTFNGSGDPNPITFSLAPTGGSGSFVYRWYFRPGIHPAPTGATIPAGWSIIPSATTNTYDPPVAYSSVSYAVMVDPVGSPDCGVSAWAAGVRQITVNEGCITSYCISPGFNFANGLHINNVTLAGVSTTSGFNAGYASFGLNTVILRSQSVAFSIAAGNNSAIAYPNIYYKIFADWNRDGDFIDLGESIYSSAGIAGLGPVSGSFTVPATAQLGRTTLRVQVVDFAGGSPCWNYFELESGEVEDYCVAVGETRFSSGTIAAGNQSLCNPADPANITFSTAATSGSTFQWYFKSGIVATPAAIDPTTGWTLIAGATGASYDPPSGLTASRTYACRVNPTSNNQWASGVRQITVLPVFSPGSLIANQTGCNAYDPVSITMATNPQGSGAYTWRWYYQENTTATCPPGTNPPPSGWITSTTDTRFFGTSTTGTGIFFDPTSSGANGRTWTLLITPAANGSIPACGTAQYATTCHRTIRQTCRMEEKVTILGDAYPNPADDIMQIPYFIADGQSNGSIKIFNSAGQLMQSFTCESGKELIQPFSVSHLPAGVYYYSLEVDQSKVSTRKLIILH
jgi:hypothetical protein